MDATLKCLSALLSYPTAELQAAAGEIAATLGSQDSLLPEQSQALERLAVEIADGDLLELQSRYVDLFDRSRSLSLNLFEHVHGESRDRGQAMVSLLERYRQHGFEIAARQLPDYLPLFLEFLSLLPPDEATAMLAEPAHILAALSERLKRRNSPYAAVLDALVTLSASSAQTEHAPVLSKEEGDELDLAAIDRAWEETEVRFGPDAAPAQGCPRAAALMERISGPNGPRGEGALP